jgi:hypothetical protein
MKTSNLSLKGRTLHLTIGSLETFQDEKKNIKRFILLRALKKDETHGALVCLSFKFSVTMV